MNDLKHKIIQRRVDRAVAWMAIIAAVGLVIFAVWTKHVSDGAKFWGN